MIERMIIGRETDRQTERDRDIAIDKQLKEYRS